MSRYAAISDELAGAPRRWLVTGAAGFIGSAIVERLLELGQQVVGLDNFATGHQRNLDEVTAGAGAGAGRFRFVEADICDLDACRVASEGIDFVLHQAALGSVPRSIEDPLATHRANVDGFMNVLLAARDAGVKRMVFASSSSVYGDDPTLPKVEAQIGRCLSPYAVSKYIDELYAHIAQDCYGFELIGLRYFNVFVLYEAVTGKNPHRSTHAEYAMMKAIVEGTIDPPSTIDPTLAPGFEQVIMKAVAKNPDERYQTAREMQLDLESCARSEKLAISALRLSDYITPVLDAIRADNDARSERFADEVDAFEDYLHAKAAEGKRRRRHDPVSATADTAPALPASNPPDSVDLQRAPRPADKPAVAARLDHIAPPIELDGVNVRTGRGVALVVGVLAAAAAALLIYWVMNRSPGEAPRVAETQEPTPEPAPIPEVGVVAASSTPEGAAVWRKLGRTPIEGLPVTRGKTLELRVVHEGYQGVALEAASSSGDDIAPVKLVPLDTIARAKPISWRAGKSAAPYQPGDARLTITSEPPAAAVWVYAGTTPGVELAELPTDQPHELRFERPGYQPAFLEITERAWSVNGRAEVHPSLSK